MQSNITGYLTDLPGISSPDTILGNLGMLFVHEPSTKTSHGISVTYKDGGVQLLVTRIVGDDVLEEETYMITPVE